MIALSIDMVIVGCNCGAEYVFVIWLLLSDTSTHHWTSSHDQYKLFHSPFISRPDPLRSYPSLGGRHKSDEFICNSVKCPVCEVRWGLALSQPGTLQSVVNQALLTFLVEKMTAINYRVRTWLCTRDGCWLWSGWAVVGLEVNTDCVPVQ